MRHRLIGAAALAAAGVTIVAGCGGSDDSGSAQPDTVTVTSPTSVATAATTAPATTAPATTTASTSVPAPPSGATQLEQDERDDAEYTRYSITGTSASDVVSTYESELQSAGYTIDSSGGGGGGWGKWGGADAGLSASQSGSYVSVQAGGESSGPTYFEVCAGPSKSSVDNCENADDDSDSDSQSQGS